MAYAVPLTLLLLLTLLPSGGRAACSDGSCIPGGGNPALDCLGEFDGVGLQLNFPFPDPTDPDAPPATEVRCFDGDAGCDRDGQVNGTCRFEVNVCLRNHDPGLPLCTSGDVTAATVSGNGASVDALSRELSGIPFPVTSQVCTQEGTVEVPLVNGDQPAIWSRRTATVYTRIEANGLDDDELELTCLPRLWPSHGYDHYNHRATESSRITPENAASLELMWDFEAGGAVTATPTVTRDTVYAGAWDGVVYAIDRETGEQRWSFDTGATTAPAAPGVQSSVTVLPDGRVLVGDAAAKLYCLDGADGRLLWERRLGDPAVDHIWASPQVANGRVFIGIASHDDQPCTQGRLAALNLDDGADLWTARTTPDRICEDDTSQGCTADGDCATGRCVGMCQRLTSLACTESLECITDRGNGLEYVGPCGDAVGGGVTATVATDVTGERVYMVSVGCGTSPRIGNADRIFALDATDGTVLWAQPEFPGEPFASGPPYRDYGFLNGPVVDMSAETPRILAAGKDGFLYAREPLAGGEIWTNDVGNGDGRFAEFGLFVGAPAFAKGRLFASLYQFADGTPTPIVHLKAFQGANGGPAWDGEIDVEPTFSAVSYANGVVFVGSSDLFLPSGQPAFFAFDAEAGRHLATFDLPNVTSSGPSIVDDELFIAYGLIGVGGVRAYRLGPEGAADREQQRCVNAMNRRFAGVVRAVDEETLRCVEAQNRRWTGRHWLHGRGSTDSLAACIQRDAWRRIARSRWRSELERTRKCDMLSPADTIGFVGDAGAVNDAAQLETTAAQLAVFGDPDGIVGRSRDRAGAACQREVARRLANLIEALARENGRATSGALAGKSVPQAQSTSDLSRALWDAGAHESVTRPAQRLAERVGEKCLEQDLATLFPSTCGRRADFTGCAVECARFHACRAFNLADGVTVDCAAYAGGICE